MLLYNSSNKSDFKPLKDAVLNSLASGKGLYMPQCIENLEKKFFNELGSYNFQEICFEVSKHLFKDYIPTQDLKNIVYNAINFNVELVELSKEIYSLELWHGPSLAFKDFGARFMAGLMSYFLKNDDKKVTILVATSGDTGGAVAFGFLNVPNIEVVILYPKDKVSKLQEKQLTTLGSNIKALEVDGTFDDCQALVKEAFSDTTLNEKVNLSSANSINIARLIPQSFYYFEAYKQLMNYNKKIVCSVPSGNFGNLTAGLLAYKMGLPLYHFIAATNLNNVVPTYLNTGVYSPIKSISTISNAMDVGNPSNFVRILELFNHNFEEISTLISGIYSTDPETMEEMNYIYKYSNYITEPHGAVAHRALRLYLENNSDCIGFFLETAHPSKFIDIVEKTLNTKIDVPQRLAELASKEKNSIPMSNNYTELKNYLLSQV